MKLTFDAVTGNLLDVPSPGGTYGVIGWARLKDVLHHAGEIRPDERITHFTLDTARGVIEYRTERRP